jgi:hypothetical protein
MQHLRNSALLLAVLLTAMPALAAEKCVETDRDIKYADAAHCFLRIDGKVVLDRICRISISGDLRAWSMLGVAETSMEAELPDRPSYGYFCRTRKCSNDPRPGPPATTEEELRKRVGRGWVNYGPVKCVGDCHEECAGNKRFLMCFSKPYLICDPEQIKAWPKDEDNPPKER